MVFVGVFCSILWRLGSGPRADFTFVWTFGIGSLAHLPIEFLHLPPPPSTHPHMSTMPPSPTFRKRPETAQKPPHLGRCLAAHEHRDHGQLLSAQEALPELPLCHLSPHGHRARNDGSHTRPRNDRATDFGIIA